MHSLEPRALFAIFLFACLRQLRLDSSRSFQGFLEGRITKCQLVPNSSFPDFSSRSRCNPSPPQFSSAWFSNDSVPIRQDVLFPEALESLLRIVFRALNSCYVLCLTFFYDFYVREVSNELVFKSIHTSLQTQLHHALVFSEMLLLFLLAFWGQPARSGSAENFLFLFAYG